MFAVIQSASWWAQALLASGVAALLLLPVGALGTRFGLWSFQIGFAVIAAGVIVAAAVLVGGLVAYGLSWKSGAPVSGGVLLTGCLLSLAVLLIVGNQILRARSVPPIHHISTDVDDPPAFDRVPALRGESANPLEYDAARLGPQQQAAYPFVQPLRVDLPPAEGFRRSVQVLRDMGLEAVNEDAAAGRIEAVATTFWFGFKDDVVVRIRADGGGSRIDLRSVSRVGRSDLGANARRIGEFLRRFKAGVVQQ